MIRINLLLITLIFCSCGARKVEKEYSKESEVTTTSLSEVKQTTEITQERKQLYDLLFTSTWRADSIVTDKQGNTKIYNPHLTESKQEHAVVEDTSKHKEENLNTIQTNNTVKQKETAVKKVDKKQYNWWYGLPLLLFIVALLYGL